LIQRADPNAGKVRTLGLCSLLKISHAGFCLRPKDHFHRW
jgi:hypothetical protein